MARIKINIKDGSIKRSEPVVGIDLGTSNSLVAFVNPESKMAYCLGDASELIVPSVIHIDADHNIEIGDLAKANLITRFNNTVYSVKRLLGRSYTDLAASAASYGYHLVPDETKAMAQIEINGKKYNPVQLSSFILKALKEKAEKALETPVKSAVITVPAYFNDAQRQATRDAGKLAGLNVLRIVNEPTAASLAYGIGLQENENKTIAVYDLGGGTFDITILQIQNGVFEVLSTNGDTFTGGDDFDRSIINFWCKQNKIEIEDLEKDKASYQELRVKAEDVKKVLSKQEAFEETTSVFGKNFNLNISRAEFNEAISPIVQKTISACRLAVKDAEINIDAIDEIVMVGGSTRVPLVVENVQQFFQNVHINNSLNPDEVVALGAAVEADILAGNRKDILLLDVTPLSLGIETIGGLIDVIIPRNSKIPCHAARQYTTSVDGQSKLKIAVYQGEREMVEDNRKLGEFILENIPAMPAGLPKIEIRFLLNADGILKTEAIELRSGVQQEITILPQYGLTDQEVEQMLLASMQHAESDMQKRQLRELKTEAEQVIYQCNKLLKSKSDLLLPEEKTEVETAVSTLQEICQTDDNEAINKAMDRLNTISRPFAERLMDEAIGKALTGKKLDSL